MFKKIISLMLVVCMLATMTIAVSANAESAISAVISEVAQDGTFTVTFYVTPNAEAELQGYTLKVDFDKTQIAVDSTWKTKNVFGELGDMADTKTYNNSSDSFVKAVWACTAGMINSDEEKVVADATGNIPLCTFKLKVVENEANYGNEATLTYSVDTSLLSDGNAKITNIPASGSFVMPDNRPEIEGLVATAKAVEYTGEVIDPASTIEVNSIEGDVVEVKADKEIKNAGTYNVTATVKRAACKATDVSTEVVVAPKAITATVANATKVYGEEDPTFTATAEGLVAGDELAYTFTRAEGEDAGKYAINATATNANYAVTVVPGELEITKKAINVTMADKAMTYGDALPEFTSDAPAGVTITPTVTEKPNAGTVAITATAESANYDVTVVPGTLTVAKKAITIKAQNEFQVQGRGEIAEYKAAVVEGLVEGDEITNIVVGFKGTYADVEGTFATEVKSYDENANYEVTKVDGVYEIKTAIPVNVTFGENKKTYGDADDAEIVVEGDLALVTITRVAGLEKAAAGEYENAFEVTLKADEDANGVPYALVVTNNKFVVEPKAATITVANAEKKVGAADPEFTATVEGLVGEDVLNYTFTRAEGEAAGEYAITATLGENPNYAITVVDGKLAISKYALTVTAPTVKVNLNKEVSALEAAVEGAADGDVIVATVTVYNGEEIVAEVDTSVEAEYTTKATSDADTDKYDVTYVDGTLTVKKASGRPSGGGSVVKPATKPEDKEDDKDDETDKPAASANIALKENAKEVKFIEGYEDKTFRPDANATRNDVVSALTALFDVTDVKNAPSFNDTDDAAIKALAAAGVINGYEDGSFKGHNDVTRAEFVKLVAAALKLEKVEGATADFSDIADHWAAEWIKTFAGKGYLVGYPDGTFRPDDKITRAEMVVVITRVVGTVDAEAAVNFADVDDAHWAYDYIMKAAK